MRIYLLLFLMLTFKASAFAQVTDSSGKAQQLGTDMMLVPIYDIGPAACKSCACSLENLIRNMTTDHFKNPEEARPISYELVDTLTDSTKIASYRHQLLNDSIYFLGHDANARVLKISQKEDHMDKEKKEAYNHAEDHLKELLDNELQLNNTIYSINVKLRGGEVIKNYVICNRANQKISYDSMYLYLWIFI